MNLRRTRVRLPILALVSVLVLAGTGMVGVASTSAASSGLVGYWALDDLVGSTSAVDSSGNGNNAACGGVAYIGSGQNRFADCPSFGAPGLVGTSAGFDGSGAQGLDQSLFGLVKDGVVAADEALAVADHPDPFQRLLATLPEEA